MKAVVNKSFATRLRGYNIGETIEVSEAEARDFANFISPIDKSESKSKIETEVKTEVKSEPVKTEKPKKKRKG